MGIDLPAAAPVLVFQTKSTSLEGPFNFINVEGKTVIIQTAKRIKRFVRTCVNPTIKIYWKDQTVRDEEEDLEEENIKI